MYIAVTNFIERSGRIDYGQMRTIIDDIIENEPVAKWQIAELTAKSTRYLIPCKQKWIKMHGLILFNKSNRQGADEEAEDMAEGLAQAGFQVRKVEWASTHDLTRLLDENSSTETFADCSLFLCCVMTHGHRGVMCGDDGTSIPVNDIVKQLSNTLPHDLPLVRSPQIQSILSALLQL